MKLRQNIERGKSRGGWERGKGLNRGDPSWRKIPRGVKKRKELGKSRRGPKGGKFERGEMGKKRLRNV